MKNWIKRAVRTFIQSALGYVCVAVPAINFTGDVSTIKTALVGAGVSALAAGLSAVINILDEYNKGGE